MQTRQAVVELLELHQGLVDRPVGGGSAILALPQRLEAAGGGAGTSSIAEVDLALAAGFAAGRLFADQGKIRATLGRDLPQGDNAEVAIAAGPGDVHPVGNHRADGFHRRWKVSRAFGHPPQFALSSAPVKGT